MKEQQEFLFVFFFFFFFFEIVAFPVLVIEEQILCLNALKWVFFGH